MNKKERQKLYSGVHPGWWDILDKYVPQILTVAPDAKLYIKEKFGLLRLDARSETHDWEEFEEFEDAAELDSSTICEWCGQPGKRRTDRFWHETLCDRCADARDNIELKANTIESTKRKWLEKE